MMHEQDELITRSEVQEMIDAAIRRHNRNASIISMCVGWVVLALFAEAHHGYSKSPKVKHPELNDVKAGDPLLVVRFTEEDLQELHQRVFQQKMEELFEEPSTYEDEEDD